MRRQIAARRPATKPTQIEGTGIDRGTWGESDLVSFWVDWTRQASHKAQGRLQLGLQSEQGHGLSRGRLEGDLTEDRQAHIRGAAWNEHHLLTPVAEPQLDIAVWSSGTR